MSNLAPLLQRKFSSEKPKSGSQLFENRYNTHVSETMPTEDLALTPPDSSYKDDNRWLYDDKKGVYFKYFWKDGELKKILKRMWWMRPEWTFA